MNIDDYIELQRRCFNVLENISDKQMRIQHNISEAKNVYDWTVYLQKQNTQLSALSGARQTIDTILKNIERIGNVEERIKKIEQIVGESNG